MIRKIALALLILCSALIWAGCSVTTVHVNQAVAVESESSLSTKWLELRNCDAQTELHRSLAEEAQVACTVHLTGVATAASSDGTLELTTALKARLTEQIESTYQQACEEAKTSVSQVDLVVPVGRINLYKIDWQQQVFSSTISFEMDRKTYTAPYTYSVDIPDATISTEMACTA